MTTASLSTITMPYSPERMRTMDRANRIGRILFNAKKRGNPLTPSQATKIVDAEIDQANIPAKAVAAVKSSAAQTLARVQRVTKIARLMFSGLTTAKAVAVVDAGKTEAVSVVSFAGTQTAANDSKVNDGVIARVIIKARRIVSQAFRKLSDWVGTGAAL